MDESEAGFQASASLEFTGERLIPDHADVQLQSEHFSRYRFAGRFVGGRNVLDLGCGAGYGSRFLMAAGAVGVVGVDLVPEAVNYARARYQAPSVEFVTGDARSLPFANGAFQAVTCFEVLEHVAYPDEVMREARRILAPGGLLVLSTPNRLVYSERREAAPNPFHVHEMHRAELVSLIDDHFAEFQLFGQMTAQGILIQKEGAVEHSQVPTEALGTAHFLGPENRAENHEPEYFLAVCHVDPVGGSSEVGRFYLAPVDLFERLQQVLADMSRDLDEKRQWGIRLDRELKEREAQVLALQGDLGEKADWGKRLLGQIEEQKRLIRSQELAIESLKKYRVVDL